ncbi:hypothetical protein SprV_0602216500 [Sparganum proliferum]
MEQLTPNLTNPQTVCSFPEPNLEGLSISAKTYGYGPGVELAATANSHVNRVENRAEEASNSWGSSSLQCPLMGGNADQPHCVTIHDASTGSANELHGDININIAAPSFSPVHFDEAKGPANDVQTAENRGMLNRDHCIIIQGLPESSASTARERVAADIEQFQKLLNEMLQPTEDVTVLKAFRLGSRTTAAEQTRPRPLKIVLGEETPTLEAVFFTEAIVRNELLNLKESTSPGPDAIPAKLLKELAPEMSKPLALIFQTTFLTGCLPSDWKSATITPHFMGGSRASANNYRPVSLTSICCKIMEKIIKKALMQFLEQHHLLSDAQHGFRSGRSCLTNLLFTLERWTKARDEGNVAHAIYIDFKKAFDSVPHQRLLHKLRNAGIRGRLLVWIQSFLAGRSQRVQVGRQQSSEVSVPWLHILHRNHRGGRCSLMDTGVQPSVMPAIATDHQSPKPQPPPSMPSTARRSPLYVSVPYLWVAVSGVSSTLPFFLAAVDCLNHGITNLIVLGIGFSERAILSALPNFGVTTPPYNVVPRILITDPPVFLRRSRLAPARLAVANTSQVLLANQCCPISDWLGDAS